VPQLTPMQTQEELPLACTEEIAKALYDELSLCGRVEIKEELAIMAARWQRNRIVKYLESVLAVKEAAIKGVNIGSVPECVAAQGFSGGGLEQQIELLQSLIAALR